MRLLHTTEFRFQEFYEPNIPDYAILSHRWGQSEVSYQEFLVTPRETWIQNSLKQRTLLDMWNVNRASLPGRQNSGHDKIMGVCRFAAGDTGNYWSPEYVNRQGPFKWIWIDTCCIDKSSSSELSEAINSMYAWYYNAAVCYAYLSDVSQTADLDRFNMDFRQSQWFTRGWTLQELLAPQAVCFLDINWNFLGSKRNLCHEIANVTDIPVPHIRFFYRQNVCAAEKFAWAANRTTTRQEDEAYCLLGLFNVNMPLLYGEGRKAFQRLQTEIIRSSNDESIFLWGYRDLSNRAIATKSLLADKTSNFLEYREALSNRLSKPDNFDRRQIISRAAYTVTNQGLELEVPQEYAKHGDLLYPLNCQHIDGPQRRVYALALFAHFGTWIRGKYTVERKAAASARYGIDIFCVHNNRGGDCEECGKGYEIELYVVSSEFLWTREDLRQWGSTKIYCRL